MPAANEAGIGVMLWVVPALALVDQFVVPKIYSRNGITHAKRPTSGLLGSGPNNPGNL